MNELTPMEAAWIVYRAENRPEHFNRADQDIFESGWTACESAQRREALAARTDDTPNPDQSREERQNNKRPPTLSIVLAKKIRMTCESLKSQFQTELMKSAPEYDWYTEGPDQLEKFSELLHKKFTGLQSNANFEAESCNESQHIAHLIEATEALQRCIHYVDQPFVDFGR